MIRRLSLAIAVAACLIVMAPNSGAAADDSDEHSASALRAGAWALQFGIGPDFQLSSFDGSVLSIKHHTSAGSAWRLGVSGRFSSVDRDESYDWAGPDTTTFRNEGIDGVSLSVGATHLWYPHPGRRVSAYYGVGPFVSLSRTDWTTEEGGQTRTEEESGWAAGADLVFGGEWFPARSIGIHAEYGADLSYSKTTQESVPPPSSAAPTRRFESSGWGFRGGGVRFGASWYF